MVGRGKKVRKGNSKSNVERNKITEVTSKLLNLEAIVSVLTYNHPPTMKCLIVVDKLTPYIYLLIMKEY